MDKGGYLIYCGPSNQAVDHLKSMGTLTKKAEDYDNPADFIIDSLGLDPVKEQHNRRLTISSKGILVCYLLTKWGISRTSENVSNFGSLGKECPLCHLNASSSFAVLCRSHCDLFTAQAIVDPCPNVDVLWAAVQPPLWQEGWVALQVGPGTNC